MGVHPRYALEGFPTEERAILRMLNCLDWRQPWGAGAQVGHLLFFLRNSSAEHTVRRRGLETILNYLKALESPNTGGWYRRSPANQEIINGAMKIISGLYW